MRDTTCLLVPSHRNVLSGGLEIKPQAGFNRNMNLLRSQELPLKHLNQC